MKSVGQLMTVKRLNQLVLPASLLFMAVAVFHQWDRIPQIAWELAPVWLVFSFLALIVVFFCDAYGWHLTLKALGCSIAPQESIKIWMISSLSRYLPGGIWPYATRAGMAKAAGIDLGTASLSLYLETLLLTVSSLIVGLPALIKATALPVPGWQVAAILLVMLLVITPWLLPLLKKLPGRFGRALSNLPELSIVTLILLLGYYLLFWIAFGGVFGLFIHAMYPLSYWEAVYAGSVLALSFCIGFIVFFVPGGIGIRESALYVLLLAVLPGTLSVLVAVGSRIWIMAGELTSLGLAMLLNHFMVSRAAGRRPDPIEGEE
ncbi:MAG: flippase-like domain-containing protein [Candidatus Thiodiazotropha sp. (ex Epidulcina cf. delphinae)]|nr:flippase-like domain-containing protein [Candidatus Thiodiazotropha sp. (ex Epidulcina cf. delphinae)]